MSSRHCFDRHLGHASGNGNQQEREFGNALLGDAEAAGKEWGQEIAQFIPTLSDLDGQPNGSWLFTLNFTLARPFTSKADGEFHPYSDGFEVQNPVARDHLTGLPLVKPTTWKGHFRFAARLATVHKSTILRLFGESLGDEPSTAGRLHFFPTFFTKPLGGQVITPLKRDTRTPVPGRAPVRIEVVPEGSTGIFYLLYRPYPKGPDWSLRQIPDDLEAVALALKALFLDYGFSAKKTAGWGVVEDAVSDGSLSAWGLMWPAPTQRSAAIGGPSFEPPGDAILPLMDDAGMPKSILRKPGDVWLSTKEFNALAEKPSSGNVYKQFRAWYDRHGPEWRQRGASGDVTPTVPLRTYPVESVTAFSGLAASLATTLRRESANE